MKAYLAAPLFSQMERRWNREFSSRLEALVDDLSISLPQDIKVHGKFNDRKTFRYIFENCIKMIDDCDVVIAVLDGADPDSGTCFEMGYAFRGGKPIVSIRTDFRRNQEKGVNLMVSRASESFVFRMSFDENLDALAKDVARRLKQLGRRR